MNYIPNTGQAKYVYGDIIFYSAFERLIDIYYI